MDYVEKRFFFKLFINLISKSQIKQEHRQLLYTNSQSCQYTCLVSQYFYQAQLTFLLIPQIGVTNSSKGAKHWKHTTCWSDRGVVKGICSFGYHVPLKLQHRRKAGSEAGSNVGPAFHQVWLLGATLLNKDNKSCCSCHGSLRGRNDKFVKML